MTLHTEVSGAGPELVLVHGWAMHGGIWDGWIAELGRWFHVTAVDLPGHGNSEWSGQLELEDWARSVQYAVPGNAWWVGWSLGGLVALAAAARDPSAMRGMILLAGSPRFVNGTDWSHGIDSAVLEQFGQQLEADTERTLTRFLSLQLKGSDAGAHQLRRLRAAMRTRPSARPEALRTGLRFLQQADLRQIMSGTSLPLRWLLGERDMLVPVSVDGVFPRIPVERVPDAGHVPFLSHPQLCSAVIRRWCLDPGEDIHATG